MWYFLKILSLNNFAFSLSPSPFIYFIPSRFEMFIQIYLSLRYCYYKLTATSLLHPIIYKHKNICRLASVTVTPDLPKIYLFDVEINENIFQIKEKKGGKKLE